MRRVIALLIGQLFAASAFAATRVDLNHGWLTSRADENAILDPARAQPPDAELVDLPHTWNREGSRKYEYLGQTFYSKQFDLPKLPAGSIVQLNFGATFYKSRVWVNGREVGGHEGGYTAYSFDITKHLREHNYIVVLVDNRPGMFTIPGFGARGAPDAWYDWWAYGGITRDVWLDIHGSVRIASQFIRSKVDGKNATVSSRVRIASAGDRKVTLRAYVIGPGGQRPGENSQAVALRNGDNEVSVSIPLSDFRLWDLDHPNLYRLHVDLFDEQNRVLESGGETFGLRAIEIRDRKLFINGAHVRLTGMTRHADSPAEGAAETRGTLLHDWQDMKSLNMTLTRPVHYAPDPRAVDFADEHGILLIPEIPVWQASEEQLSNPRYLELAKRQFRELIEQFGNHPSVFAWSVMNESAAGTPGGIKFFRAMRDYIKSIDPSRPVTMADDNLPKLERADESAANDADFLMMNEYFGAWHGPREALGPALDKVNGLFPDKMVIISEMGYPGIFAKKPADADPTRVSILREQLPELAKREWIGGAILWCYQDYKSRRYFWPGQEGGYLEHGIVDENRQRKPSYFAWKTLNEPARVEPRWTRHGSGVPAAFEVTVTPKSPSELPYYPLAGYRIAWQLTGEENRAFASGTREVADSPVTIEGTVPARDKPGLVRLVVKLLRPDGSLAMERSLAY